MWWEYLIIFAGLGLAVVYALWFVAQAFSGKGGCGSAACQCGDADEPAGNRLGIKSTPIVQLESGADHRGSADPPDRESR